MQGHRSSAFAAALVLAFAGFTGTALAGGGHGHGGGSDYGSSAQSQWSGSQHGDRSGDHGYRGGGHDAQSSRPSSDQTRSTDTSKHYGNGKSAYEIGHRNAPTITSPSQLSGPGNSGLHKVTICHKTGSGYVAITVDVHALRHGHTAAKGDIVPAPDSGCPTGQQTSGEQQTVAVVGYCHQVAGRWVYATAPASEVAKLAGDSDVIAPHFSYHGKDYSSHWDSKGQSIFERCRHGEQVSAASVEKPAPVVKPEHKVTICHATGSSTNPYVEITVDKHALEHGHTAAKGDIIPAPASGCPTGQTAGAVETQHCGCTKSVTKGENESKQQPTPQPGSHKVTICHATGSATNPYVEITVDKHALEHGHTAAKGDLIPAPAGGCPTAAPAAPPSVQTVTFCDMSSPTTGKLETKPVSDVLSHELNGTPEEARDIVPPFTANGQTYSQLWDSNGQAIYNAGCNQPAQPAAQQPATPAPTAPSTPPPAAPAAPATPAPSSPAPSSPAPAPAAPAPAAPATSGTAGAQKTQVAPATQRKAAAPTTPATSGVRGASHTVRSTPTSPSSGVLGATLPFTGFPLWGVALAALVAIGIGLAFNRAGSRR